MARQGRAWAGWVTFAGCLLFMLGTLNVVYGLFALFENEVLVASEGQLVLVDLTAWGLLLLIFGAVQMGTGVGLFMGNRMARWVAIVIAILHAVSQLGGFSAYPFWSTLMIALDTVILFALTVHWREATGILEEDFTPTGEGLPGDERPTWASDLAAAPVAGGPGAGGMTAPRGGVPEPSMQSAPPPSAAPAAPPPPPDGAAPPAPPRAPAGAP